MIEQTPNRGVRRWVFVSLIAAALALVVAGVTGAWIILFLVPCMLMMGMMMWMMGGMGHGSDSKR